VFTLKICKKAVAGTLESSDALVEVEPGSGIAIDLESAVLSQFGDAIEASVRAVLAAFGVTGAKLRVVDRGALDCTIRARVETAIKRAKGDEA